MRIERKEIKKRKSSSLNFSRVIEIRALGSGGKEKEKNNYIVFCLETALRLGIALWLSESVHHRASRYRQRRDTANGSVCVRERARAKAFVGDEIHFFIAIVVALVVFSAHGPTLCMFHSDSFGANATHMQKEEAAHTKAAAELNGPRACGGAAVCARERGCVPF